MEENKSVEYDAEQAKAYLRGKFIEQGDFLQIITEEELDRMLTDVMAFDEAYMAASGADDGAVYDDDAAFDYMDEQMNGRYPAQKMYLMRFVEDYMDYMEQYLDSIGAIDWE